ncbi:MAG: M28 family peptidase [Vicinamibacterales bacterium]
MTIAAELPSGRLQSSPTLRLVACAAAALLLATASHAVAQPAVEAPSPLAAARSAPAGGAILATVHALTAPGMDGRAVGTAGNARARAWILERFRRIGLRPAGGDSFEAPFTFTNKAGATLSGVNLLAQCPGRLADLPVLVVSAHYDHLGVRDGQTYHGADDNASGVAMLMTVAERCIASPFDRTLVLAAFDAEEQGLQGARAFVAASPVPADRIALNLNFDMVSRSDRREIYVAGPGRWPLLLPIATAPASRASIDVKFGHDTGGGQDDWTMQSDHGPFHTAGIPFVYLGVEDHADYHKPGDTADKIDAGFLGGVAAFVLDLVAALDGARAFKE